MYAKSCSHRSKEIVAMPRVLLLICRSSPFQTKTKIINNYDYNIIAQHNN